MHPTGQPMLGPTGGPYHHPLPPNPVPYHDQVPTTSHPSWHTASYSGLPTPPYHPYPPPQAQPPPNYPPMPPQQHPPQHHLQMTSHQPQMTQLLTQQQLQQQQQIQQNQQQSSAYSSPSHAPSTPIQNQKARTEQWVQSWPYAQSPAPSVAPSVMSYHQNDDRMSMLSVNTSMTNQFPDSQRCFSSNGSTCENVNPEMAQTNWAQGAEQAIIEWFNTKDPQRKFNMAMTIREWVKRDKMVQVDPAQLPGCIQRLLLIIHDGMKPLQIQVPPNYYPQLWCYLLDILNRLTSYRITIPNIHQIVQLFEPKGNQQYEFRDLICNAMQPTLVCAKQVFDILENIIKCLNNPKYDKLRSDFARSLKFEKMIGALLGLLSQQIPPSQINPTILVVLRFIISKDAVLKNCLIWGPDRQRDQVPPQSILMLLKGILMRSEHMLRNSQNANFPDQESMNRNFQEMSLLAQVVTRAFDLLNLLMHDSNAIDGFVKVDGIQLIYTIINYPISNVVRSGFKLLLQVSDSRSLCLTNLKEPLPFIMQRLRDSLMNGEDDIVYSGTGFLSNVVAHKLPVKELAIAKGAIPLLCDVIMRSTPLSDFAEASKKKLACGIVCNSLRAMNNFLMMWIPMQNGQRMPIGEYEQQQFRRFIEEVLKRLMTCLSMDSFDVVPLMELRSTILRFFFLVSRTPSMPADIFFGVTDDFKRKNLVGHIAIALSWADGQKTNEKIKDTRQQLIERAFSLLVRLIEQYDEVQVAHSLYTISCPLNMLNNEQMKPQFILNVLRVCDRILEHSPMLANGWSIYSSTVEMFKNHSNPDIARTASSLLARFPIGDSAMDEGILHTSEFTEL
ncbi:unnamed protein product [Caenorhabditis nigoni]